MSRVGLAPYLPKPYFKDHIPNKPIEYLSAGLPVLSTPSGEFAELLLSRGCGLVYQPGDAMGLAACARHLYDRPAEQRRLSENAAVLYRERFMADKVYPDLVRYLESLARAQPCRVGLA
jgi:glycosyltransferase involved in cell wall biosynthesis